LNFFNPKTASWAAYVAEIGKTTSLKIDDMKDMERPPAILTAGIQRDIAMVKPWMEQGESFILVGPEGCGKNLVIRTVIG